MTQKIQIDVRDSLDAINAADWNALNTDGNPFVRYEFLHTLDRCGCLGKNTGWYPRYFLLWSEDNVGNNKDDAKDEKDGNDDSNGGNSNGGNSNAQEPNRELVAAVASYVKTNSYGEFVFDWAWAEAYERNQLEYYPKLVVSIPFTPATGPRILVRHDQNYDVTLLLLAQAVRQFALSQKYSSVHYLFLTERESNLLSARTPESSDTTTSAESILAESEEALQKPSDHLKRLDCQYHWHNHDYASFDDFLKACTSKRRKTIRRERRHVSDAGIRLEQRMGSSLTEQEWHWVHEFYQSTFDRKWGNPSLTEDFFQTIGSIFGENVLIVFAYDPEDAKPDKPIACSIMFIGEHTLYGRFWGCRRTVNSLHFETCYYQGIAYCIEHGIKHFEPGAQGEHKITRGFEPQLTRSAHFIAHPGFRDAIANFLIEETPYMEQRCAGLANLLPFKADTISL